ncbi:MAG: hypothetical protein GX761_09575 [Gammaproteobacteria bacterium]|uniref:hypothetical protein n=1 Tax=Luteimonas sp. JM171 TaxID=1896164 RepID=UPI00085547C2|nr:hypothetical protein [Luteimonas sp. JM171]AOH36669.1 hypothetical protein BGP89_10165 [Luteimonas sp. JM171]NLC61517.1 hypothetical protein [Gammaproteobacteria bacterium]
MSPSPFLLRTAAVSALAVAVLATSGCGWFRKENALYAQAPENRPLEVPPDLDRPGAAGAMAAPDQPASVTRSQMQAPAAAPASDTGFAVAGDRDEVYAQVGQVLAQTEGLTVVNSAQLLGTYDVNYEGSNFMVRVARTEAGAHVSAVDPRGQPAQGEEPRKLIGALRAQLGG